MNLLSEKTDAHKILVVGPPFAGKSTFITRYVHGDYFPNEAYKATNSVDFALKNLTWKDGRKITLQFWDIAGQERTQKMSRMYYQDAHACVIMFDMTEPTSLDICLEWKKELDSQCTLEDGEPLPCLLLANKSDLASRRQFSPEQIKKFAEEHGFILSMETSVRNNVNITEAMNYLVQYLLDREGDLPGPRSQTDVIVPGRSPTIPNNTGDKKNNNCC